MKEKMITERKVQVGGSVYNYKLRRHRRAKRIILRLDHEGGIVVVLPNHLTVKVAEKFILERASWLEKAIGRHEEETGWPRTEFKDGSLLSVLGDVKQLEVVINKTRSRSSYKEDGNVLRVMVAQQSKVKAVMTKWYRARAVEYVSNRANQYAQKIGVGVKRIVISGARSQWGSCMKDRGRISVQWRLAQAPLGVMDYVIAHEVSHLKFSDHSKDFWRGVKEICPDFAERRRWLKANGHRLYWKKDKNERVTKKGRLIDLR